MNVSVVGTGIMGTAMAKRLLEAGHAVTVNNRTQQKARPLLEIGAAWANSPAEAAAGADIVISIVTDPKAVDEIALGARGVAAGLRPSGVHAEMSTVAPESASRVASTYAGAGLRFVQAPVSGSVHQIEQSTLLVLAGGASDDIDQCRGAWNAFAKKVWTLGSPEQAAALKLAVNMMIGQMILGLGQSMTFATKFGIPARSLLDVVADSALAAPMYKSKGQSILEGRYAPNFVVSNLLKDLNLAHDAATQKSVEMPMNDQAREMFRQASTAGYGGEDYSAVVKLLAAQAGVRLVEESR